MFSISFKISLVRRAVLVCAGIALLAIAGVDLITRAKPVDSLAVLPFVNVSGDPATEYLSDGITESVINNLSRFPKLSVRSFGSVVHYKNKEVSPRAVGRELNVRAVLTARLVRRGDEFAISAKLVDVNTDRQVLGSQYTRRVADLPSLPQQISQEISEKLHLQLSGEELQNVNRHTTGDTVAYQLYLQGRYQWNKRTLEGLQQSIDFFNQAIQKDPRYALAYAGLADADASLTGFNVLPIREVIPRLQSAAAKALELDNTLTEAHTSLAWASFHVWDWAGAEREFKRALDLNPGYSTAHLWYGEYLSALGRFDEAQPEISRAVEQNPLSPETNLAVASRAYYARQGAQAIEQAQKVLAIDSTFVPAHELLGRAYLLNGSSTEAAAEFRKALELSKGDTNELAAVGYAEAISHQEGEARKILQELMMRSKNTYVQPVWLAVIELGLGEKNQALDWLEKAYADRSAWLLTLRVAPFFDAVRSDPRFDDLMIQVRLKVGIFAVVVRPDLPIDNLSSAELRRLFRGERQYWTSNLRTILLFRAPGALERDVTLNVVSGMNETQFRQYWIERAKTRGDDSAPRIVYSSEMAAELIKNIPGMVTILNAATIPAGLKVLRIDGLLPGDSGYSLRY